MRQVDKFWNMVLSWSVSFRGIAPRTWRKHVLLFVATFVSMTWTYYLFSLGSSPMARFGESLVYSVVLCLILMSHELGHFIHARFYGVEATLPMFLPMPYLSPFGTLGAFIRMKTLPPDKRALFDISYWGPAMSFFTSLPAIVIGLMLSEKVPVAMATPGLLVGGADFAFGSSLLFDILTDILIPVPEGYSVLLHPLAFAGWVGLFVTAINLFPIGQLDGGHIAYCFLGKRQKYIAYVFFGVLIFLALNVSRGWLFWVFMLFFMGLRHPHIRMVEAGIHIDRMRIRQAVMAGIMFVVCFVPEPLKMLVRVQPVPARVAPFEQQEFQNYHDIRYVPQLPGKLFETLKM